MRRRVFSFVLAFAAFGAALAASGAANAAPPTPYLAGDQPLFFDNIGAECPGFAPFYPENPATGEPGTFNTGYFFWDVGEYLEFPSVTETPGHVFRADGSGVPTGEPGWTPTSGHTYRVIGRVTAGPSGPTVPGRVTIIRDDGSVVSGEVEIQIDGNHGIQLTGFTSPPDCRLR